jgi:hypothetical protein
MHLLFIPDTYRVFWQYARPFDVSATATFRCLSSSLLLCPVDGGASLTISCFERPRQEAGRLELLATRRQT